MPLPIGRFIVDTTIYSTISLERSLGFSAMSYVNIGSFSTGDGQHTLFLSAKELTTGAVKQFSFSMNHNHTAGSWFSVNPLGVSAEDAMFDLEVNSDGSTVHLRLRRAEDLDAPTFQLIVQNLGRMDSSFVESSDSGADIIPAAGELSSIPFGSSSTDHNQLANRGVNPHSVIDAHLASNIGHIGHENISNKNVPLGYAGLNNLGRLFASQIPFGSSAGTVCQGDDPRLVGGMAPAAHAPSHMSGGSDELNLGDLQGQLPQAKTHVSADTDVSTASIHHTLGIGANQAAPGDHNHDDSYGSIDNEVPDGALHTHDGVDTARVDHMNLEHSGSYAHEAIDEHIDASSPHAGHELLSNKNQPLGYAGLDGSGKHITSQIPFGSSEGTVCQGNDPRLLGGMLPANHAPSHMFGGADELSLSSLSGSLPQSRTHNAADTDSLASSIHHTLGTGETQAAPGNHQHTAEYDLRYAGIANGVTNGNAHDHSGGDGATISHLNLDDIGVNTHANIDAHIDDIAPHSGHESLANKGMPGGYPGLTTEGYVPLHQLPPEAKREIKVVGDIETRDLLDAYEGLRAHVLDATADPTVGAGWAEYIYGPLGWVKTAELESIDIVYDWSNITGTPSSSSADIDNAVSISHQQNDDTFLAVGTVNQVGASEVREHLDDPIAHSGHEITSDKGQPSGYTPLDADGKVPPMFIPFGASNTTACIGNDSRLNNDRNPVSHEIISDIGIGERHSISGGVDGYVFKATGPNTAMLARLQHEELGKAGAYSHADIDSHIEDPAPHSDHSLVGHTHEGSDVTSQVSDSDTVDGMHASEFALAAHPHNFSEMEDVDVGDVESGDIINWTGSAYVGKSISELGIEPAITQNTAFNKNFGANADEVARGNHNHDGVYSLTSHNHDALYAAMGHNHNSVYLGITATAVDSSKLGNMSPSTTGGVANTIPATNASGALDLRNVVYDAAGTSVASAPISRVYASDGTGLKHMTPANFTNAVKSDILNALLTVDGHGSGLDADTLDGVHASGFATSTHAHDGYHTRSTSSTDIGIENTVPCVAYVSNSLMGASDGALYSHVYSNEWKHQIQGDYRTGQISVRGKNNGTWQPWRQILDSSNYTSYAPQITYGTTAGTACQGNDARLSDARYPALITVSGDWNNVLTTGLYQGDSLANQCPGSSWRFCIVMVHNSSWVSQTMNDFNGTGVYWRNRSSGVWSAWKHIIDSSNHTSYAPQIATRDNWNGRNALTQVAGQIAWKNYGDNHTIFDASNSTSPNGISVNSTNPGVAWSPSYPTLMGWNGANTYGVRVDSCRIADSIRTSAPSSPVNGDIWIA